MHVWNITESLFPDMQGPEVLKEIQQNNLGSANVHIFWNRLVWKYPYQLDQSLIPIYPAAARRYQY